jgi:hypothetical protein
MVHFRDPDFPHATACLAKAQAKHVTSNIYDVTCKSCRRDVVFIRAWRAETGQKWPVVEGDLSIEDRPV